MFKTDIREYIFPQGMQMSKSKPILLALMMILMSATPFFGTTAADHEFEGTGADMTVTHGGSMIDMWHTHDVDLGQNQVTHVDYTVEVTGMTAGHEYDVEMYHFDYSFSFFLSALC